METQGRLIVDIARLDEGGEWYRGETAPEVLDFGESEFLTPLGGIVYALKIQTLGTELRYGHSRVSQVFSASTLQAEVTLRF